jgi:hypothetical protein
MAGRNVIFCVMNLYVTLLVCNYMKCKCCCALCIRGLGAPNLHNDEGFTKLVGLCRGSAVEDSLRRPVVGDRLASIAVGETAVGDRLASIAVGEAAVGDRLASIAVGEAAVGDRLASIAVGDTAVGERQESKAVGETAVSVRQASLAVGERLL